MTKPHARSHPSAQLLKSAATVVWAVLVSATLLSWALGTHHGIVTDSTVASLIILVIAFVKIRYIGLYFMDLRDAPLILRALLEAWCMIVCALTCLFYMLG